MKNRPHKMMMLGLLLVAAVAVLMMGTDAAYHSRLAFSGQIQTAAFDLAANGSSQDKTFDELNMEPNKDYSRTIRVDTSGCQVDRMDVSLALSVSTSGTVPPGFAVTLDGQPATSGKTLVLSNAQRSVREVPVGFRWSLSEGEDATAYRDFSFSYTVSVEGRQQP